MVEGSASQWANPGKFYHQAARSLIYFNIAPEYPQRLDTFGAATPAIETGALLAEAHPMPQEGLEPP